MFGNKFAGDNIAREFLKIMGEDKFSSFEKKASDEEADKEKGSLKNKAAQTKPEDFLIAPEEEGSVSSAIDSKIESMADDLKEETKEELCESCGEVLTSCACDSAGMTNHVKDDKSYSEDFIVDSSSEKVLEGLGKITASLRNKDCHFAADVVAATAMNIKEDLVKEAARKAFVLDSLTKMASNLRKEEDTLAADMVDVTIQKIKSR